MTEIEPVHQRTPIVTIELPIWPSPPKNAVPHWWGLHRLGFTDPGNDTWLWESELPWVEKSSRSASVRYDERFGWIVTLVMTHDRAKILLDSQDLPFKVERIHTNSRDKP